MLLRDTLRNVPLVRRTSVRLRGLDLDAEQWFEDHYVEWRTKRIAAITEHYGPEFFHDQRVLEVGCGFGDIGAAFAALGAQVTCSDARAAYLAEVRRRHLAVTTVEADLDRPWRLPHTEVLLHLGVLYHLRDPEAALRDALAASDHVVLETEVVDSDDSHLSRFVAEAGYDQAFNHRGSRPSAALVERVLDDAGRRWTRVDDDRCNTSYHQYDWVSVNSGEYGNGQRRFWFVEPPAV